MRRKARTDDEKGSDVPSKEEDDPLYTGLGAARLRRRRAHVLLLHWTPSGQMSACKAIDCTVLCDKSRKRIQQLASKKAVTGLEHGPCSGKSCHYRAGNLGE